MYNYKTLEKTSIETLHEGFVKAFSDYQVKMDLPIGKFEKMLKRRGYTKEISMGAFENEDLVGFTLNALRKWDGKTTVYDTGTGVVYDYRKQGITSIIFKNIKSLLKEKNVEQYLLEVLKLNTSAVELYKKQGFTVTRNFECFKMDKSNYKSIITCKIEHVDGVNEECWDDFIKFWDIKPSWQNSIDSVRAAQGTFIYSIVRIDNKIVGYGIIDRETGDIPQIAVNKDYRGKGIGRSIVSDLINNTNSQKISVVNIDSQCEFINNWVLQLGFEHSVSQYEMILNLLY